MGKRVFLFGLSAVDELNLSSRLRKRGYRVSTIPALERIHTYLLREPHVGLVFDLDEYGEKMYGIISYVKKIAPGSKFVLLSSNATKEAVIRATMSGSDYYILKPLDPDVALEKLEKVFAKLPDVDALSEEGEEEAASSDGSGSRKKVKVLSVDESIETNFNDLMDQIRTDTMNGTRKLVFNLNNLDTTAVTVIAKIRRLIDLARENGADAAVVLDPQKELMKVIDDSGLLYDVEIYSKLEEATRTA